jgi:hypothetical protein
MCSSSVVYIYKLLKNFEKWRWKWDGSVIGYIVIVTFLYSGFTSEYCKHDGKNHVANALLQI